MTETTERADEPKIEERGPLYYVAIPATPANEAEFRNAADSAFPELFGWLGERSIEPAGPPLIRFLSFEPAKMAGEIELALEVAIDADEVADERVRAGVVPAGRYAIVLHVGPYTHATERDLGDAHAALLAWAHENGIELAEGSGGFLERYLVGPNEESDYARWRTELVYSLKTG